MKEIGSITIDIPVEVSFNISEQTAFNCLRILEMYIGNTNVRIDQNTDNDGNIQLGFYKETDESNAKKPEKHYYGIETSAKYDGCPTCGNEVFYSQDERDCDFYCNKCGQKLDWSF